VKAEGTFSEISALDRIEIQSDASAYRAGRDPNNHSVASSFGQVRGAIDENVSVAFSYQDYGNVDWSAKEGSVWGLDVDRSLGGDMR
jgi:hypothetical protein